MLASFAHLRSAMNRAVIGQPILVDRLLIALLADGHPLVEGLPGLAKTRVVRRLAELIDADFHRIQFTPDLLPADLTGSDIYRAQDGSFRFERGPIFHNLLLADEINRAPAKVQSALLEAMGERQVTVGQTTYPLPPLFMVMATQNPIEHEGTYPLPEAQRDRFLLHVNVGYPDGEAEREILALARQEARSGLATPVAAEAPALTPAEILAARREVLDLHLAPEVEGYVVELVRATRSCAAVDDGLAGLVRYGASPRGAIALERCARAHAWLDGRDYVSPDDVQQLAPDVLRHRLVMGWEAQADGVTPDEVIARLLQRVPAP